MQMTKDSIVLHEYLSTQHQDRRSISTPALNVTRWKITSGVNPQRKNYTKFAQNVKALNIHGKHSPLITNNASTVGGLTAL